MAVRRSKEYRQALSALCWDNGTSRWDVTRSGCFHCGSVPDSPSDLKRNVCVPCRTLDFHPTDAPVSNPMAHGYRVCTDHCTTVPLPLHLFANGNRKCLSCLEKRRLRKLRKRDPTNVDVLARLALLSAGHATGVVAGSVPSLTKRRRRNSTKATTTTAANTTPARLYCAVPAGVVVKADPAVPRPSRQSARKARSRIAAIGKDLSSSDDGGDSVEEWKGEEEDSSEDEAGVGVGAPVRLPVLPVAPTATRVLPSSRRRATVMVKRRVKCPPSNGNMSDSTIESEDAGPVTPTPPSTPTTTTSDGDVVGVCVQPPPRLNLLSIPFDWSSAGAVATPKAPSSPFPVDTAPLPLSPTPSKCTTVPTTTATTTTTTTTALLPPPSVLPKRSSSAPASSSRPKFQPFSMLANEFVTPVLSSAPLSTPPPLPCLTTAGGEDLVLDLDALFWNPLDGNDDGLGPDFATFLGSPTAVM